MVYFNEKIEYCLPPQKPESNFWINKLEYLDKQTTHCEKLEDGNWRIVFGYDACEKNVIEFLNHEYLHASLGIICEHCSRKKLHVLWYCYKCEGRIFYRKILEEMSYSGIGYPTRASWIDGIRAFIARTITF